MGDDKSAVVEHVMADKAVEKLCQFFTERLAKLVRQGVDLGERLRQTVRNLHILAAQLAHQLHIVIAGNTESGARRDHVADKPNTVEDARATIHEIADEDRLPTLWMRVNRPAAECR